MFPTPPKCLNHRLLNSGLNINKAQSRGGAAVLVVNDNPSDAVVLAQSLRDLGVAGDIVHFPEIGEADRFLGQKVPSVTFIDLQMNSGDPLKALEDWKQRYGKNMLFVVVTDETRGDALQHAYARGADSFLAKPLAPKDLENLVGFYRDFFQPIAKD